MINLDFNSFLYGAAIYLFIGVLLAEPITKWHMNRDDDLNNTPLSGMYAAILYFMVFLIWPIFLIDIIKYFWRKLVEKIFLYIVAKKLKRITKKILKDNPDNEELKDLIKKL